MKTVALIRLVAIAAVGAVSVYLWQRSEGSHVVAESQDFHSSHETAAQPANPPSSEPITETRRSADEPALNSVREGVPHGGDLLSSPEIQERAQGLRRAVQPTRYPDVGHVLGLTPDEEAKLFDLLANQDESRSRELQSQFDGTETRIETMMRLQREDEAELMSLLGSKYPQWQDYRAELPSRLQVKDFQAVLSAAGMQLSDTTIAAITSALIAENKRIAEMPPATRTIGGVRLMVQHTPESNDNILRAVAPHLTVEQLEAYRKMLERKEERERNLLPPE